MSHPSNLAQLKASFVEHGFSSGKLENFRKKTHMLISWTAEKLARQLDEADPLRKFRQQFRIPRANAHDPASGDVSSCVLSSTGR